MKNQKATVDGYSATFITETFIERKRVENLTSEEKILSDVLSHITKDDIFYDIGANIGIYSMLIADKIGDNNVIAVEPHPKNVKRLHENANLNSYNDMIILDYGFFDTNDVNSIRQTNPKAGEGKHHIHTGSGTMNVNIAKGDDVISEHNIPQPTVMKIDVEGAEYRVLCGLRDTLSSVQCMYIEYHHDRTTKYGDSINDILDILNEANFSIDKLGTRGAETFFKAYTNEH